MATDLYAQGFGQFLNAELPEDQVKGNPPQWRAGYRAAQSAHEARHKIAIKPEKIDRVDYTKCTINYALVSSILLTPRFHFLNNDPRLYPFVSLIRTTVLDKAESLISYDSVVKEVHLQFDVILQWGYDEDILTVSDCEFHGYTPSVVEK